MAIQLVVPGRVVETVPVPYEEISGVTVLVATSGVETARGAEQEQLVTLPTGVSKEDVVIELDLGDGVRQWSALTQLQEDGVAIPAPMRGGGAGAIRISPVVRHGAGTRGVGGWILKGLKVLHIDPAKAVTRKFVAGKFEDRLDVGLKGLDRSGRFTALPAQWEAKPYLLFIHGTASSTHGAFAQLFVEKDKQNAEYQALFDKYEKCVIAFEHKTLGVGPITNALELARALPAKATLHLVTHSRGGLVGDLLCLDPQFPVATLTHFDDTGHDDHARQKEELKALRQILDEKQFLIERYVRVACPARGTILASERLDLFATVILNMLTKVPKAITGPFGDAVFDGLKEVLVDIIKLRMNPAELPGLEAQMPRSPLVKFLRAQLKSSADLAVIAGDMEGSGFLGKLKELATDAFYQADHDLVVDTKAMYGGVQRKQPFYYFDKGTDVDHFSYFENKRTRMRMSRWLTDGTGFDPYDMTVDVKLPPSAREATARPILFVVPAEFGSTLITDDKINVWPNVGELLRRGLNSIVDDLKPDALSRAYQPLLDFFGGRYDVRPFPWDWRNSIDDAGDVLASACEEALDSERPVRFIGHGLGGLVIRSMAARKPELWQRALAGGGRALLLGTAQKGTHWGVTLLAGINRLARLLSMIGKSPDPKEIRELLAKCPGIYDLLPTDCFTPQRWTALGVQPNADLLAAAAERRKVIEAAAAEATFAVVGEADATPADVRRTSTGLEVGMTAYGDGRVTWESASLSKDENDKNVPWHVGTPFGNLIADTGAFHAFGELLEKGETRLLPRPNKVAMPDIIWSAADNAPLLFPDDEDLADAGVGPRVAKAATRALMPLRISILNGGVNTAHHPVIVGHYIGDPIVSVEKVLDGLLDKGLSRRFHLNVYPGADGTNAVVFGPKNKLPGGAIVVGLGEVGKLTADKLRRGVTDAAIRYSVSIVERDGDSAPATVSVSSVLVGSNGGTALSIETAIHAVVRGIVDANRAFVLRDHGMRIDEIELVELVQSRAVIAAHALRVLEERLRPELADDEKLDVKHELETTEYVRYDTPLSDYAGGWPRRLRIVKEKGCQEDSPALRFTVLTDRARAETTLHCTSEQLIKDLVDSAATNGLFDPKTASALYELLIPNDIKDAASDESSVVLIVDDTAAQFPWELCVDRLRPAIGTGTLAPPKPLVIDMALIRQFETPNFRLHPRTPQANLAFVVGDTDSGLIPLAGAEREGRRVAELLRGRNYTVHDHYRARSFDVVRDLFSSDYRILHIATHGIFNEENPKNSGIVLGKDIYLTACEIRQMRVVPELVFLNCCHLGHLGADPATKFHRVAASVSRELIEMGVSAVVAAGWAVDDDAAVTFAETFYDELITQGGSFSSAVKAARNQTWKKHGHTNTWGAYQCYGNPDFRLVIDGGDAWSPVPFCSRHEYLSRFRSARAESNVAGFDERRQAEVASELRRLRGQMKETWADGELETAYALAIAEMGDYKTAIDTLEKAVALEKATMPINGIEQLANFRARYAAQLYVQNGGQSTPEIRKLFDESLKALKWLLESGETAERLSLVAATWKRKAFVSSGARRKTALASSAKFYERAKDLKKKPYPIINWALVESFASPHKRAALVKDIDSRLPELDRTGKDATNFWDALAPIDGAFTRLVVNRAKPGQIQQLAREYRAAAVRFGSAVMLRTIREHFAFTAKMLRDEGRNAEAQAVEEIITALS